MWDVSFTISPPHKGHPAVECGLLLAGVVGVALCSNLWVQTRDASSKEIGRVDAREAAVAPRKTNCCYCGEYLASAYCRLAREWSVPGIRHCYNSISQHTLSIAKGRKLGSFRCLLYVPYRTLLARFVTGSRCLPTNHIHFICSYGSCIRYRWLWSCVCPSSPFRARRPY